MMMPVLGSNPPQKLNGTSAASALPCAFETSTPTAPIRVRMISSAASSLLNSRGRVNLSSEKALMTQAATVVACSSRAAFGAFCEGLAVWMASNTVRMALA